MLLLLMLFQDITGVWQLVPKDDQKKETLYFFPDGRLWISSPDSYHELTYQLVGTKLTFIVDKSTEIAREIKLEPQSLIILNEDVQTQYLKSNMPLPKDNVLQRKADLGPLTVSVPQGWKSLEDNSEKGQTLILLNEEKATQIITTLIQSEEGVALEEVRDELMDQFLKQLPETQIKSKEQVKSMFGFQVPSLEIHAQWRENTININGAIIEIQNHTLIILVNAFEDLADKDEIETILGSVQIKDLPALRPISK